MTRYFEESDLDQGLALQYFPHCGDEDYDFFQCPRCHRIYLFEYEADAVFLDPWDGRKRLYPRSSSDLLCVSCDYNFRNENIIGEWADSKFKLTLREIAESGWGWLLNDNVHPDVACKKAVVEFRRTDTFSQDFGEVDSGLFLRFLEAYGYDNAASIGWLRNRLNILRDRLREGQAVYVTEDNLEGLTTIDTMVDFEEWVERYFRSGGQ